MLKKHANEYSNQYTTFFIDDEMLAIPVNEVQEVTNKLEVTHVPLAPGFVRGLVNLRGQIATAIDLKSLLEKNQNTHKNNEMSVICLIGANLVSLIVDEVGDVIEVSNEDYENTPSTLSPRLKEIVSGIYKYQGKIVSVIDLEHIQKKIEPGLNNI